MHPKAAWVEVFGGLGRSKTFARGQEAQKGPGYARTKTPLLFVVLRPVYLAAYEPPLVSRSSSTEGLSPLSLSPSTPPRTKPRGPLGVARRHEGYRWLASTRTRSTGVTA